MQIASFLTRSTLFRQPRPGVATPVISLENVRVASPCPMSWEQMTGDDRVRHCQECKLNVYNLSEMTRADAERMITNREGRLCVRFYRRADGTILTQDCPVGLRALSHRVSRVAGAALTAIMSLGTAFAQNTPKSIPPAENIQTTQKKAQIALTVVDSQGALVPGAKILLSDKRGKKQFAGVSNPYGVTLVSGLSPGTLVLRIEFIGFKTYKKEIAVKNDAVATLQVVLKVKDSSVTVVVGMLDDIQVLRDRNSATIQTTFEGDFLDHLPLR